MYLSETLPCNLTCNCLEYNYMMLLLLRLHCRLDVDLLQQRNSDRIQRKTMWYV